jgi:hypothetical protein
MSLTATYSPDASTAFSRTRTIVIANTGARYMEFRLSITEAVALRNELTLAIAATDKALKEGA